MTAGQRIDTASILAQLKPFQRATVDYVHQRFWLDESPAHRFLVADEVGLGKTLVARGVIAKAIEHLQDRDVKRIDVVYICSNAEIAQQNIARLNVSSEQEFVHATRITLLPKLVHQIKHRRINFFAITPGTSFEVTSNSYGSAEERVLIFRLLSKAWSLELKSGPLHAFRGGVASVKSFKQRIEASIRETPDTLLDETLRKAFVKAVAEQPQLRAIFRRIVAALPKSNSSDRSGEVGLLRRTLMRDLRKTLARVCIEALEPDLIILDEFQRFKHLLATPDANSEGDDEPDAATELARSLFDYHSAEFTGRARILMLSATPYRMFSPAGDAGGDDHYEDFIATYRFLADENSASASARLESEPPSPALGSAAQLRQALEEYRIALLSIGTEEERDWRPARDRIEQLLRRFMARTERLAVSSDRNGMLVEVPCGGLDLRPDDIVAHREVHQLAQAVDHPDTTDYWKSAPYIGAFGRGYKLLGAQAGPQLKRVNEVLTAAQHLHLPPSLAKGHAPLDPPHPRLRWLHKHLDDAGLYDVLWLPPSLPYYALAGAFHGREGSITKRLIFSAWQMVPKAIASLLSAEAERRHFGDRLKKDLATAHKDSSEPLVFSLARRKPERMSLLALLYPSFTLAELGDPVVAMAGSGGRIPLAEVWNGVASVLRRELDGLRVARGLSGAADQRWYWAAPLLLDLQRDRDATESWLERASEAEPWRLFAKASEKSELEDVASGAEVHFAEFKRIMTGSADKLGPQPDDLVEVLADLALGSPAVCALRALVRGDNRALTRSVAARDAAATVAQGFRTFFNTPAVVASLRRGDDDSAYWRTAAAYGRDGCLQALLDEWFHVLPNELGKAEARFTDAGLRDVATAAHDALSLRSAQVLADAKPHAQTNDSLRLRTRFAVRLADQRLKDDDTDKMRGKQVRAAFNAPFWPFVLVSTSVGQEGLDFHTYCHAVVHWNLPYNPVDLEQREGRVHRFKNHAVRRNAARLFGAEVLRQSPSDPWVALFERAREATGDATGLIPYWVLPCEDGARIERHVPNLPLSRDAANFARLRRELVLYRMVFGQPRQDELLDVLARRVPMELLSQLLGDMRIDLTPYSGQSLAQGQ